MSKTETGFLEFIVAQSDFSISILPAESSLDFVSFFVYFFVKPSEHARNDDRFFSIPPVGMDDGDQSVLSNHLMIRLGIKT